MNQTEHDGEGAAEGVPEADATIGPRQRSDLAVELAPGDRWIESREGGWFFVNAVLAAPAFIVAFPLLVGGVLRAVGVLDGYNRFIDTIPLIAAYVVPYAGLLAVIPLWLTLRSLRWGAPRGPRIALRLFGLAHAAALGYALWWWLFSRTLPPVL